MHPYLLSYNQVAWPKLKEHHTYASAYLIPKVTKVSINAGVGDAKNPTEIEAIATMLAAISGQKPIYCKARKAISGFKIRQGMVVGLKATLRGERMYDFLTKLIQVALPRTRDFRGITSSSITSDGSLNIGIKDSAIFPEMASANTSHSLQVTLVSSAKNQEEARILYESLGFIFQNAQEQTLSKKKTSRTYKRK